jgi:hypothetical protein
MAGRLERAVTNPESIKAFFMFCPDRLIFTSLAKRCESVTPHPLSLAALKTIFRRVDKAKCLRQTDAIFDLDQTGKAATHVSSPVSPL